LAFHRLLSSGLSWLATGFLQEAVRRSEHVLHSIQGMTTRPTRSKSRARPRRPAGISNHPIEEELESQSHVAPRGTRRGETEPALRPRPDEHPPPRAPAPKQRKAKYPRPE
jgi:hypothetical protein